MKNKALLITLISIIAVIVILGLFFGISAGVAYNGTITLREDIDASEAEIKNRLQERHDKMGQLISAVEGLQEHAETIYAQITAARAAYAAAVTNEDLIEADALEAAALDALIVTVESNPQITATSAYNTYMYEVSGMENALFVARRDFNEAVLSYNTTAKKFPRVLFIGMFGFERELEYWKTADGSEEIPMINVD
ncbi:MAG: LemA family protein [Clostridia bacterium]|jgi:LemA protein|nr:LemA family protein [Clostridia bacterium]